MTPRRVRVGPFTFRILAVSPDDPGTLAETNLRDLVIRIDPDCHEDVRRETLLHELLHACHLVAGIDADTPTSAEAVVTGSSPLLFEVLRRDRALRAYLFGP